MRHKFPGRFWKEELFLSKKRFILFALVAAIVLSFAGSAFAGQPLVVRDFEWSTSGSGGWGDAANWRIGGNVAPEAPIGKLLDSGGSPLYAPNDTARVIIPSDAGVITIPQNVTYAVEQIVIKGTYNPDHFVEINIGNNSVLVIESSLITKTPLFGLDSVLQIDAEANVKFTGNGRVVLKTNEAAIAEYRVRGKAVVDFQVKVDSPKAGNAAYGIATSGLTGATSGDDPLQAIKTDTGKLYFTGNAVNEFVGIDVPAFSVTNFFQFLIQDGEVGLGGVQNFSGTTDGVSNGIRRFLFSDGNIHGRTPTFTALWSGSQSVGDNFQLTAESKFGSSGAGTINVEKPDGILRFTGGIASVNDNAIGTINGACIPGPDFDGSITKTGPGTLRISGYKSVVDKVGYIGVTEGTLRLSSSGTLDSYGSNVDYGLNDKAKFFDDEYFAEGLVAVELADGTTLRVDADTINNIAGLDGVVGSTTIIEETARLNIWGGGSTYEGQITDSGSLGVVTGALEVTGEQNDFSGETHVSRGGEVIINNAKNLGGTRENTIYLEADYGEDNGHVIGSEAKTGGLLHVAKGAGNILLPNRIYLGNGLKVKAATGNTASDMDRNRNVGEARIQVWRYDRLQLAGNIYYNANTLFKFGQGDLYLTDLGYDSTGDNRFTIDLTKYPTDLTIVEEPPTVSAALRIFSGLVRIEERFAVDHGDIITDATQQQALRPVLSIGNGIEFSNNLLFTNAAVLATELTSANLSSGTNVQSAIGVGYFNAATESTEVRIRVAFNELEGGVVKKGDQFQLIKAVQFNRLNVDRVVPEQWDVQGNMGPAPFDVRRGSSSGLLFFEANSNIDIPQIGTPNILEKGFGEDYTIRIPVGTTTGLMENSAELSGPLYTSGAKIAIEGNELVITGKAPAAPANSEDITITYNVAVASKTDRTTDTYGLANYKEGFTLTITENPGSGPVGGPVVSGTPTLSVESQTLTGTFKYTVDTVATASTATISLYKGGVEGGELLTSITDAVITADEGYALSIDASAADFAFERDTTYTVTVTITGSSHVPWVFTAREDTPTPTPVSGSSGGGCDAGLGVFGLLAATGAVALLRKKD
jgi:hypothetical protein